MGRVQSNSVTLAYAREQSPGVLPAPPKWRVLEPNAIDNFGSDIKTVAREPLSKSRQRRKGSVVDLDSPLEVTGDLTLGHFTDFIEAMLYSIATGPDAYESANATATGLTVPALSAAQAGRIIYGAATAKTLFFSRGYVNAANNGLKVASAASAAATTEIKVGGCVAEVVTPKQDCHIDIAGVRAAAGDLKINAQGHLTSTALNFTTLGLVVGQVIHIGGVDVVNRFFNPANFGFARIKAIAANLITLERRANAFVADEGTSTGAAGGAAVAIDILFGQFIRNVDIDHADYREITHQFELTSPNLGDAGAANYEYATGNYADAMTATIPLTDKATVKLGFVGMGTVPPSAVRAAQAANAKDAAMTASFGTANDIARLRLMNADETGLSTDFKSLSIAIKNNAAGEKVLGKLGNKYVNAGQLQIDLDAEMLFTSSQVVAAIRSNATVGLDFTLRNDDGGVHFDIPSATISGGKRSFKANESVTIAGQIMAFKDNTLGTSIGVSLFPVLPKA